MRRYPDDKAQNSSPYELDGRIPLRQALPLGLQHVLAMFVGNLSPLLIIMGVCSITAGAGFCVKPLRKFFPPVVTGTVVIAIGLGYGLGSTTAVQSFMPQWMKFIFGGSGIVPAALIAILLNIILPKEER